MNIGEKTFYVNFDIVSTLRRLLIEAGADLDARTDSGRKTSSENRENPFPMLCIPPPLGLTALALCSGSDCDPSLLETLLSSGADPNLGDGGNDLVREEEEGEVTNSTVS